MPATPNITLTATLLDFSGATIGSATQPAWLRIALCGYGATLPSVAGTGNLARVSSWFQDIQFTGTQVTVKLWGNDQITPSGTFYMISVLDTQKNVVQSGLYEFTGTQTVDLSNAPQIVSPAGYDPATLRFAACSGAVPGTVYVAPGQLVVLFYNGVALIPGLSLPTLSYTLGSDGVTSTLNFTTQTGDKIYALYLVG